MGQIDLIASFSKAKGTPAVSAIPAVLDSPTSQEPLESRESQGGRSENLNRFARLDHSFGVDEGISTEAGKALAMLSIENREAIQAGAADLARRRTLANNIAQRVVRERGMIPAGWEAMVLCEQCGPVWWTADAAPTALGCPWCDLYSAGRWFPRPEVQCGECRHFTRDRINPPGGLGVCQVDVPLAGLCFPHSRKQCPAWQPHEIASVGGKTGTQLLVFVDEHEPAAVN